MNASIASIVIATHNRPDSLRQLLVDLSDQSIDPTAFEVIVVDDESPVPVTSAVHQDLPLKHVTLLRVPRGGPGAARNAGAREACGFIVIFVDDDMRLPRNFVESHLSYYRPHLGPLVVLGNIQPDSDIAAMPLFERYHARQLERFQRNAIAGAIKPRGLHLCTGNVSMRLLDFLDVGGFDITLSRSEDRELGIRLEQRGCRFVFGQAAVSMHGSDHRDPAVWRNRNDLYGRADLKIARKHPDTPDIHPWRFWSLIPSLGRPLAAATLVSPPLGRALATSVFGFARVLDRLGADKAAISLTGLTYCLDYFRGLRREAGSLRATRPEAIGVVPTVRQQELPQWTPAPRPVPTLLPSTTATKRPATQSAAPAPALAAASSQAKTRPATPQPTRAVVRPTVASDPTISAWQAFRRAVRADHDTMRAHRAKYHAEHVPAGQLPINLVRKVGFQLLTAYRVMRLFDEWGVPLLPQVMSRLIRHLYGAEIHWKARIDPGVSVVHGVGLVLSHAAQVGSGCILFQGVTLGESVHPVTGTIGAPRLEAGVHVGPGATILGPVTIGAATKVMAGSVVTQDVPPRSLVSTPAPQITLRQPPSVVRFTPSLAMQ